MTSQSWGSENLYKCSYEPGDITPIHTSGNTKSEARSLASDICFERRMALLDRRGLPVDEEQELMTVDSCVNICD